jgi:hypothetical protein
MRRFASVSAASGAVLALTSAVVLSSPCAHASSWLDIQSAQLLPEAPNAEVMPVELVLQDAGAERVAGSLHVPGLLVDEWQSPNEKYSLVRIHDESLTSTPGAPALPIVRRLIVMPADAQIDVRLQFDRAREISLADLGYAWPVAPWQPPVSRASDLKDTPFQVNRKAYTADWNADAPQLTVTPVGVYRGYQLALLEIQPVIYCARDNAIRCWSDVQFDVQFIGGRTSRKAIACDSPVPDAVLNPSALTQARGTGDPVYLIVVHEDYTSGIAPFVAHKQSLGYDVITHELVGLLNTTQIKNVIRSYYDNPATTPDYVLLIGDTNVIGHWTGGGAKQSTTDLPYCCMDEGDDWLADFPLGRLSVRNLTQLADVFEKLMHVEVGSLDEDYVSSVALLATDDMSSGGQETQEGVITDYFAPNNYTVHEVFANEGGGTSDIAAAINDGCAHCTYFGHSSTAGWWGPHFYSDDVRALSNVGKYPVVLSFSCNAGRYTDTEVFGETFLLEPDKGASAVLAASTYIYWTTPPWHEASYLEESFYHAIFAKDNLHVGNAWFAAIMRLMDHYGASDPCVRDYAEMYNLLGEPGMIMPRPQGFQLEVSPTSYTICQSTASQVQYTLNVGQIFGFTDSVQLSLENIPAGAGVTFSQNPVTPPATVTLTLDNLDLVSPAVYAMQVRGQSGSLLKVATCNLAVAAGVPAQVALEQPSDATVDVHIKPFLQWTELVDAAEYELQLAQDPAFTTGLYTRSVQGTSHEVEYNLNPLTMYYWRVRGVNGCGDGVYSPTWSFTTFDQPDYMTEQFPEGSGDPFDLAFSKLTFTPVGSGQSYTCCREDIDAFPIDPTGGTELTMTDDGQVPVVLTYPIEFFGQEFVAFYVHANGHIALDFWHGGYQESLEEHFEQNRVAMLFDDLNPEDGGTISLRQMPAYTAVTFEGVPEWGDSDSNSFQVVFYQTGVIEISWLEIGVLDCIVGLSPGGGVPETPFPESDLSAMEPCLDACPWDVAPGTGDGIVGVDDFFGLLQNWGPCPVGDCPWDMAPEPLDGVVGVDDFFALLQHWGPCE